MLKRRCTNFPKSDHTAICCQAKVWTELYEIKYGHIGCESLPVAIVYTCLQVKADTIGISAIAAKPPVYWYQRGSLSSSSLNLLQILDLTIYPCHLVSPLASPLSPFATQLYVLFTAVSFQHHLPQQCLLLGVPLDSLLMSFIEPTATCNKVTQAALPVESLGGVGNSGVGAVSMTCQQCYRHVPCSQLI